MSQDRVRRVTLPFSEDVIQELRAGDRILLSGDMLCARDAAHKKMVELLDSGEKLPLEGSLIYYCGPSPARPGRVIGAAGPTTSGRMDSYTPRLLGEGLRATMGKGRRSPEVVAALRENRALYLGAIGGAGALLSKCIKSVQILAWEELGPEALMKMEVIDFPAVVINDVHGGDLFTRRLPSE